MGSMSKTDAHESKKSASRGERRFAGIPVGPGVAIGPICVAHEVRPEISTRPIAAAEVPAELARLDGAVLHTRAQFGKLRQRIGLLPEDSQHEITPLIDAYLHMLGNSRLLRQVRERIETGLLCAEAAMGQEAETIAASMQALSPNPEATGRAADEVREIGRRVIRNLTGTPFRSFAALPVGAILITEELRPAEAALLDPGRIAGIITAEGGADGHTAVMLRALGIPSVLGAAGITQAAHEGDMIVVDGTAGTLILKPSAAALTEARRAVTAYARERSRLGKLRELPAVTLDGEDVQLQANLELPLELPLLAQAGAAGIGLVRSEFLFMNRARPPGENEQAEIYRGVVEAMAGDPVTIRVLDWGGEKDISSLPSEQIQSGAIEQNPALGLRGIRMLLQHPEVLETQLAAILRAGMAGPVRILLPMITNAGEVREVREIYQKVIRKLRKRGEALPDRVPPLGVMIETPGAALAADALALEADFFAIGTNDLTMYTLAVDRGHASLASLYDPLHPAVLRLVQFATEAALRMHMPVSVCGEIAGNPRYTRLLLGLGLRSFSMNAATLPRVKQVVRGTNIDDCVRLARRVMEQPDIAKIRELIAE
jgi:phosphotransferase system enzyme I (PtsI)